MVSALWSLSYSTWLHAENDTSKMLQNLHIEVFLLYSIILPTKQQYRKKKFLAWLSSVQSSSDVAEKFCTWTRFKQTNTCLHTFIHLLLRSWNILDPAIFCRGGVGGFDLWPLMSGVFLALSASWTQQLLYFQRRDFFFLLPCISLTGCECRHFLLHTYQTNRKGRH